MKKLFLINFIYISLVLLLANCSNEKQDKSVTNTNVENTNKDSLNYINIAKSDTNFKGIMIIPEQPALCILDSASPKMASSVMEKNYSKILEDVNALNLKVAEQPGCIFYFTSPEKIVFETFLFLKSKPEKQPKYSKPVILEKTLGLLYDHYGTFNTIHQSYEKIKILLEKLNYQQSGPAREIYVLADDTAKWRTRIIIPVVKR
jgi:effector-binding domain-containing protein